MKLVGYCFLAVALWVYISALTWVDAQSYGMVYLKSDEARLTRYKKMWKVIFVLRAVTSTTLGALMARIVDMLLF